MRFELQASGFLGKVIALLIGVVLLVFFFMFSLFVLAPLALIGLGVLGYQLQKIRKLHKEMFEPSPDGHVIEGEVIHEFIETDQPKSVRAPDGE